jgi:hypothetical protein
VRGVGHETTVAGADLVAMKFGLSCELVVFKLMFVNEDCFLCEHVVIRLYSPDKDCRPIRRELGVSDSC